MAGPWFTVLKSGDDWQRLGTLWISNGQQDGEGHVEIKVEMEADDECYQRPTARP